MQAGNSAQGQQLNTLMEQTRENSIRLKERIKTLQKQPVTERAAAQRKQQLEYVRKKFMDAIEKYMNEEKEYRDKYKDRMARRFKIGKFSALFPLCCNMFLSFDQCDRMRPRTKLLLSSMVIRMSKYSLRMPWGAFTRTPRVSTRRCSNETRT